MNELRQIFPALCSELQLYLFDISEIYTVDLVNDCLYEWSVRLKK